jgi:hypothetical protein
MIYDAYGFQCICGEMVAVMHTECRGLMSQAEYERFMDSPVQARFEFGRG